MKPIIIQEVDQNTELNQIQISLGDSYLMDANGNNISENVREKIGAVSQQYVDDIIGNIITLIDNL